MVSSGRVSPIEGDWRIAGTVVSAVVSGVQIFFFVKNPDDSIQRYHYKGQFYEQEELDIIRRSFDGGTFIDIGANVGNHTIYAAKFLKAAQIIPFEVHAENCRILRLNVALNNASEVCLDYLGIGLFGRRAFGDLVARHENNLGLVRVQERDGGGVPLAPGDELLAGRSVSFLKIDVEGLEMEVLEGLAGTIAKERPTIFIEVENRNAGAFHEWCTRMGYAARDRFKRYDINENYLIVPA